MFSQTPLGEDLGQEPVDELLGRRVVAGQADAVVVVGERLSHDLHGVVGAGVGDQDALVDHVRVDAVRLQRGQALCVVGEQAHLRAGCDLRDPVGRRGALLGGDRLTVQVLHPADAGGVRLDHHRVTGAVVGAGEGHLLGPLRGDRVGRHDHVDRTVLDQGLAGVDGADRQGDGPVGLAGDVVRQQLGQPGVEAGQLARGRVLHAEQRTGVGATHPQRAGLLDLGGPGTCRHRCLVGDRPVGDDLVVVAHVGLVAAEGARVVAAGDQPTSGRRRPGRTDHPGAAGCAGTVLRTW